MAAGADFDREVDPQQQIRQFIGVIRRGWLALLTCLGAGLLVGLALYFFIPKTYVSSAKLELHANWMFDSLGQARDMDTLPFALRRKNLEDQLRATTYVEPVLDGCEWDDWSRAKAGGAKTRLDFLRKVKEKIETRVIKGELGETLVFVNFGWHDRERAREFCEKLTKFWIDSGVENYASETADQLTLGERLLAAKKDELDRASLALEQFQVRHGISGIDQRQGLQLQADRLAQESGILAATIANLEAQVDALDRKLLATGPDGQFLLPPTLPSSSPLVNSQRAEALLAIEATVKIIDQRLAAGATAKDRKLTQLMKSLEQQLIAASERIAEAGNDAPQVANPEWRIVYDQRDQLALDLEGRRAQRNVLDADIAGKLRVLATLPEVLNQHDDLLADVALERQRVFDQQNVLQPLRDKKFQIEKGGPNRPSPATEIERPVAATSPSAFLGMIALAVSTLLGVGIALLSVVGRELLRASFSNAEQARRALKLPVLGEVAPIQTVPELRRARYVRSMQIAASLVLLGGLGAAIWVCVEYPNELPRGLVEWAMDLRASLA